MCEQSSDDEIFVLRRMKPVVGLTRQRAIDIKNVVLAKEDIAVNTGQIHGETERSKDCPRAPHKSSQKRKGESDDEVVVTVVEKNVRNGADKTPKKKLNGGTESNGKQITPNKSPSKQITDFFTPIKSSSEEKVMCSAEKEDSMGRRKKPKVENIESSPEKTLSNVKNNKFNRIEESVDQDGIKMPRKERSSYFYCQSLKTIIHHEIKNQAMLEELANKEGKSFQRLLLNEEYEHIEKFFKLPDNACELYARMLCRKKGWHKVSGINYNDINGKIEDIFKELNKYNFVDFDIEKEELEIQLELLSRPQIQTFCKAFNVRIPPGGRKHDCIEAFVKNRKTQTSISDFMTKNSESNRKALMQSEIIRILGPCVRLSPTVLSTFNRLLLLFSLTHEIPDEDKWNNEIRMITEVKFGIIQYPKFKIKPTVIFKERDDLICYEHAMKLRFNFDLAMENKNYENYLVIGQEAKMKFKEILKNEALITRYMELPSFLKKYSAGSVYASILTIYCEKHKKITGSKLVIEISEILLSQQYFSPRKIGRWYNALIQAQMDLGNTKEAATITLKALKNNDINEVDRLALQQRGQLILKKKKNGLMKCDLRDELDELCMLNIIEPSKMEINARALDKSGIGCKATYVQKDKSGTLSFSSVEETVINYYEENGFGKGIHSEGYLIQTMYFLIFFDIIYDISPVGVFQNPYQTAPLDFNSKSFYTNRKKEIDIRLKEMRTWTMKDFEKVITEVYEKYDGVHCVITWRESYTPSLFCEILKCLGIPEFTAICERLVRDFRSYRSGFPDLTVWNPVTGKCKFVEVKSPNDKLSPKQRIWLDFLRKINVNCEVCNVKNVASRKFS